MPHLTPQARIVEGHALEAEAAIRTRRNAERKGRGFENERAAAAHRIEQCDRRRPAGEAENSGGEIFAKRRIHRIQSPTLIVWGESDGLVSPAYAEDFRSGIKDSRVVILPQCGHFPMFEKQDEFVDLVTSFLAE